MTNEEFKNYITERTNEVMLNLKNNRIKLSTTTEVVEICEDKHATITKRVNKSVISCGEEVTVTLTFQLDQDESDLWVLSSYDPNYFKLISSNPSFNFLAGNAVGWNIDNYSQGTSITVSYTLRSLVAVSGLAAANVEVIFNNNLIEPIDACTTPVIVEITPCYCASACEVLELEICNDSPEKSITVNEILNQGRALDLSLTIKNVCSGRSLAIGIFLKEKSGDEYIDKGFKVIEYKVPSDSGCVDAKIDHICFPIKGDLCKTQNLIATVIINYLNFNFEASCK